MGEKRNSSPTEKDISDAKKILRFAKKQHPGKVDSMVAYLIGLSGGKVNHGRKSV